MIFHTAKAVNKHIGAIIFPEGGLADNWFDKEGADIALSLSYCMVVKYRTNAKGKHGFDLVTRHS